MGVNILSIHEGIGSPLLSSKLRQIDFFMTKLYAQNSLKCKINIIFFPYGNPNFLKAPLILMLKNADSFCNIYVQNEGVNGRLNNVKNITFGLRWEWAILWGKERFCEKWMTCKWFSLHAWNLFCTSENHWPAHSLSLWKGLDYFHNLFLRFSKSTFWFLMWDFSSRSFW